MRYNKICIIGVGLIGGSIAKQIKAQNIAKQVIGYGRNIANLSFAKDNNIIDDYQLNIKNAISGAEIIIIATPVNSLSNILVQIKPHMSSQTILSDVGSTKCSVIKDVVNIFGDNFKNFIPAHPIAGNENSTNKYADKDLFINKKLIITPMISNTATNINAIKLLWQQIGAKVEIMDAKTHDYIFAISSHLPHLLAFSYITYMAKHSKSHYYTGGGFKDFSRIASSNDLMWADILLNNKVEILQHLKDYQQQLDLIATLIKDNKQQQLQELFSSAKKNRDSWLADIS